MKVGYARVSTEDQTTDPQIDALRGHGCETIYLEHRSGKKPTAPSWRVASKPCERVTPSPCGDLTGSGETLPI